MNQQQVNWLNRRRLAAAGAALRARWASCCKGKLQVKRAACATCTFCTFCESQALRALLSDANLSASPKLSTGLQPLGRTRAAFWQQLPSRKLQAGRCCRPGRTTVAKQTIHPVTVPQWAVLEPLGASGVRRCPYPHACKN